MLISAVLVPMNIDTNNGPLNIPRIAKENSIHTYLPLILV